MTALEHPPLPPLSVEARRPYLDQYVAVRVGRSGARVEQQLSPTSVVLVYGKRPNHILHLLLSVFTAGFWLIVWLILSLSMGEKRRVATVDAWGRVTEV